MSNSRLDGVRKGTRIPDLLLRRQSLYPTELYGPIVLKPAISRGLTPYIVFLGLDNILSEEGIIHGLLLSIYCRVRSHFSRRFELTTNLPFFSRLVLALFLRRRSLYPTELPGQMIKIFSFPAQRDLNQLPLRRRTLYPAELSRHITFRIVLSPTFFVNAENIEKCKKYMASPCI